MPLLAIPDLNIKLALGLFGLMTQLTPVHRLELLDRPPRAQLLPSIPATDLWQVIRGPFILILMLRACPRTLIPTLRRSLFTFPRTILLSLLLALIRKEGLLRITPSTVRFTPLPLFPPPGVMVTETIGLGKITGLRAVGPPGLVRARLARMPPTLTRVMTLFVRVDLILLWLPVRTLITWSTCLAPFAVALRTALFPPIRLEQTWAKARVLKWLLTTPKVRVCRGPLGLIRVKLLAGPFLRLTLGRGGILAGSGRQLIIVLSMSRMFPPPKEEL